MENVGTRIAHDLAQILLRRKKILLALLHPVEAKCGGMIFEPVQALHPCGLIGQRNLAEADEHYLRALRHEARNQFARVGPHAAERVRRNQYPHRTPAQTAQPPTAGKLQPV